MVSYDIFKVGIVGGGTMGGGIAALIARQGLPVLVKEENEMLAARAREVIFARFQKWHDNRKINASRLEQLKSFIEVTARAEDFLDVELFIEAVPEKLDLKIQVFKIFDAILPKSVVMVSNTSSLPITQLAEVTGRRDRVAGMHFFNPPTTMPLVELIRGRDTSDATMKTVDDFAKETLQKMTIRVIDRPGFLVNRLLMPYLNEAVLGIEEARVSPEAIDDYARKCGWRMGPFTLLDVVGIDTAVFVLQFLAHSCSERVVAGGLFEKMLTLGRLGDKVGAGFYSYSENQEPIERILERLYPYRRIHITAADIFERMVAGMLNEAVIAVETAAASKVDIELGAKAGIGFPGEGFFHAGGPLHTIDKIGAPVFLQTLERLQSEVGPRFSPTPLLRSMAQRNQAFFSFW